MNKETLKLLQIFGAGLVKSGILKPGGAAVREAGESAVNIAQPIVKGLFGSRRAIPAPAPSALPRSAQALVGNPNLAELRPGFREIVEEAARRRASALPTTEAPGVRGVSPLATNRTPVQGPTPPSMQGPSPAEGFRVPLDGRQLDMFSGFNRLTYPKGTVTAEGIKIGGKTFNPSDVQAERQGTEFLQSLVTRGGKPFLSTGPVDEETLLRESLKQTVRPMASVADEMYSEAIPRGTGFFSGPVEFGTYQARNLMRSSATNLAELIKANPRLAAAAGIGFGAAGVGGIAMGLQSENTVQTPSGPVTESVDAGGLFNDPQVHNNPQLNNLQQIVASMSPGAQASLPTPVYRGADGQTVIVQRGEDEALRAQKQQYASRPTSPARGLENYYRQREAYASFPKNRQEIVGELSRRGILDTPELTQWAAANPTLAYELLRKATGSNTLPSQQTPQIKQYEFGTALGTNNINNAFGNSEATAQRLMGTQGAADLASATYPQVYERIEGFPASSIRGYYIK